MKGLGKRAAKKFRIILKSKLAERLELATAELRQVIMNAYDNELVDVVTDVNSKSNPNFYRSEFKGRIDVFIYLEGMGSTITINCPSMETFDFSGRLKVIETILNGLAGTYVEINEEDYIYIYGKKPINKDPIDEYVSPKEMIYLTRNDINIRKAERSMKKKFVRYPFSNTPPIKILEVGEEFVANNKRIWIKEAITEAKKEFISKHKGAAL